MKSLKYYCKYDSLQDICIWFYLSHYPDLEVCWHGEALKLEGSAIRIIPVPAGTETTGPGGAAAYHNKTVGWCRLQRSQTISIAPATAVLSQAAQTHGQCTKDRLSNFLNVPRYTTYISSSMPAAAIGLR